MISPEYYNPDNTVQLFLGGKVKHFLRKPKSVVAKSFTLTTEYGDNLYMLASKLFGPQMERLWPIIGDINPARQPDEWRPGESVIMPEIIISDVYANQKINYENAESTATLIQY